MPRQPTVRVNQGYRIDSKWEALALAARGTRRLTRLAWRWRTEVGLALAVLAVRVLAGRHLNSVPASLITDATVVAALGWPRSRALILGRFGCAWTRRRLLACMRETRVATSAGRLPFVLRARVTAAGERLTFGLFPGQSCELLDARTEELRAAARARDVTVTRDPARADRVTVDVIRRDPLAGGPLRSPLLDHAAALHANRDQSDHSPASPIASEEVI